MTGIVSSDHTPSKLASCFWHLGDLEEAHAESSEGHLSAGGCGVAARLLQQLHVELIPQLRPLDALRCTPQPSEQSSGQPAGPFNSLSGRLPIAAACASQTALKAVASLLGCAPVDAHALRTWWRSFCTSSALAAPTGASPLSAMYFWTPANIFTARVLLSALSFSSDVGMQSCTRQHRENLDPNIACALLAVRSASYHMHRERNNHWKHSCPKEHAECDPPGIAFSHRDLPAVQLTLQSQGRRSQSSQAGR